MSNNINIYKLTSIILPDVLYNCFLELNLLTLYKTEIRTISIISKLRFNSGSSLIID